MSDPHRTAMLANLGPADRQGRRALGCSCLIILMLLFGWGMLCAGFIVSIEFSQRPLTALLGMTAASVLALPYLLVILWLDRNEPEPPWLLATAFAWGAVGATALSILGNGVIGGCLVGLLGEGALASQATASLSAPFVEELAKGIALLAIYVLFRNHFDNVLDGIVYGALVGLGFAVFENFTYYMKPDQLAGTLVSIWIRGVVSSPGTHICFTAITGAFVGFFRVRREGVARWGLLVVGVLLAMFAHFCWNTLTLFFNTGSLLTDVTIGLPLAVLFLQLPFLTMVAITAALALRHERRIIETYLAAEVQPVLYPGELQWLVPARRRTFRGLQLLSRGDFGGAWGTRRRNRHLVQLAFEKWHMDQEASLGAADAQDHAMIVRDLRRRLTELPAPPA